MLELLPPLLLGLHLLLLPPLPVQPTTTAVSPQVRNNTVVFPRRERMECKWFCNSMMANLRDHFQRGLDTGKLRVPEGLPMLW